MNILLINPPRLYHKGSILLRSTAPLGLAYIAGALKNVGHEVTILDAIAEAPYQISDFCAEITQHGLTNQEVVDRVCVSYDMIGMSCMFTDNWLSNRELLAMLKAKFPDTKLVIGGEHASATAQFCLEQVPGLDAVIIGEGEETITALSHAYTQNSSLTTVEGIAYKNKQLEILTNKTKTRIRQLDTITWPAWEIFPLKTYFEHGFSYGIDYGYSLPVMATRGCPYECTFCSSPQMWGTKYSMRSPEDMFNEIRFLYNTYGATNFDFYDLTAIINRRWIIEFSKLIINSNLNITWQIPAGTRSESIDDEVSKYLFLSGCKNITYAPESGSQRVLDAIGKKVTPDKMIKSIVSSYKNGLNIKLNMIMGFPGETHSDVIKTLLFMVRATWHGAHDAAPAIFSPYPGSELFEQLSNQGNVNLYDDSYLINIIKGATYFSNPVYNQSMHKNWVRFYAVFGIVLFYTCSYLFKPMRFFKTIRNMITNKHESRAEINLAEFFKRFRKFRKTVTPD